MKNCITIMYYIKVNKHRREGFTLIEILVALAIMAITLTTIIQLFSLSLKTISISASNTKAIITAENYLKTILTKETINEDQYTENIDDNYTAEVKIEEIEKEKTQHLTCSVYNITATLKWTKGINEKTYTLTTQTIRKKSTLTNILNN
ncbi:Prepilin-type cleavage/methylation protein [Candidatus Magnetoovum chiemensis]|nr:Prepilin-type cleavage/methylation protein [Candidatus Magnetoovum chiemensis]